MENNINLQKDNTYNTGYYLKLKTLTKQPDCWFLKQQKLSEESIYTADTFLNGACGIFAMVLHNIYGYPLYVLQNSPFYVHAFCKKDDKFVDIRGITNDFSLFIRPFNDKDIFYKIEHVIPTSWEKLFQEYKTFYKENFYTLQHIAQQQILHTQPDFYKIKMKENNIIKENIYKPWQNEKPTDKQLNLIKDIEDEFGESFVGTTKGEASDYIDKWLAIAHNDINRSINWDAESRFG